MVDRLRLHAAPIGAGLLLCFALPPWGFWPLTFPGLIILERLIADRPGWERFSRGFTVGLGWFMPSLIWMRALTLPGYVIACVGYSLMIGVGVALAPPGRARWIALPGGIVAAEVVRWHWPFGGVPLSNLGVAQVAGPLAPSLRVISALGLVWLTVVAAMALAAAIRRDRWAVALAGGVVVAVGAGLIAPRGEAVGEIDVALVQGGGPQGTSADETDPAVVFARHLAASDLIEDPVDLIVWPEDVVDVERLEGSRQDVDLANVAREHDAVLIAGVIEDEGDDEFRNAAVVYDASGRVIDRYEKVERVPFGEWVPLRPLLELVAKDALAERDARSGDGPAVVDTPLGRLGVAISWEVFFDARARDAIGNGGLVLLNPTNGSSFEGTLVQTQQIANSRMRAIETGRWVPQIGPTGLSAFVTPGGRVLDRTAVSERIVIQHTVELRDGLTIANRVGDWPGMLLAAGALIVVWWPTIRSRRGRSPVHR